MRLRQHVWLAAAILVATGPARRGSADAPVGFTTAGWAAQAQAESAALKVPTADAARSWLRRLTAEPHVAGTPADRRTAEFVRDKLIEWGWKAELVEYEVLLNYPMADRVAAEIVRPNPQPLKVREDAWALDKDSASQAAWPAFHGYGASGEVSGQVVYANYGRPEDFAALDGMGVDVPGKIVLVRYGTLFRGLKVYNAQKRGAAGVLIYSDPADDGYMHGDVYPMGPYRPPSAIQRGSVMFLSLGPGDPTTPGWASTKGAKRLPWDRTHGFPLPRLVQEGGLPPTVRVDREPVEAWEKATGLKREDYFATIPSLPISYEAARPILEALGGSNAPGGWQGGLPHPYHVGPGPSEVHFRIQQDYGVRPIWNVVATIEGAAEPDRWVLVGNHRDAWTYGAVDPGSGTAATMEACRAIGAAVRAGWKPRRTLKYCSWDAEEYGLVGSTEWAEEHAEELGQKAVLMLNVDSAVSGPKLDLDGIPSMRDLLIGAADALTDPRDGKTLKESWTAGRRDAWAANAPVDLDATMWEELPPATDATTASSPERFEPQMGTLGSGSDYTAFVDHLGIPAVDANFVGSYGVYHAVYDDFYWMEKFGDPGFLTHAMAARFYTLIAMRAAGADVVPLTFTPYGEALREQVDDLRRMVLRKQRGARPPRITSFTGLETLVGAVKGFRAQAVATDRATKALAGRADAPQATVDGVNEALVRVERSMLAAEGLPGRTWFKHTLYAPGLTTGYASWPLPGVRRAILEDDPKLLAEQVPILVRQVEAATAVLKTVAERAEGGVAGR